VAATILLVDDDPVIHELLERTLDSARFILHKAYDGKEGLEKALETSPDLIISDVLMPEMDGWAFVQELRSRKEMMLVPVIFLTALSSPKHRFMGFRLGADDYCPKPFDLADLRARIDKVLARAKHTKRQAATMVEQGETASLTGTLEQMAPSAVLTILEMERKSGVLVLEGERTGQIYVSDGHVVDAALDDQSLVGTEAVYDMLQWTVGRFDFYSKEIDLDDQIKTDTPFLLMEAARRADEGRR